MNSSNRDKWDRSRFLLFCMALIIVVSTSSVAAQDPVMDFIIAADSIYKAAGEEALTEYVGSKSILTGAAVHTLIDIARIVGDQGSAADEKENMEFAELISRIYMDNGGDPAPYELVAVYREWTPEQRKARAGAKTLEDQAAEARKAREFDTAAEHFARALDIYKEIGDTYSEARIYGSYGVLYWYAGDFDSVLRYYMQALSARRAIDNAIMEGSTLNGIGSVWSMQDQFDSSEVYYKRAIDLRSRTGDLRGLGTSLTYLGNIYYRQGMFPAARKSYSDAAEIVAVTGNRVQQIDLLNSVANVDYSSGQLRRSSESYFKALEIALDLREDDPEVSIQSEISIRMNISTNLTEEYRYREALSQYEIVGELLEKSPNPQKYVMYTASLSQVYSEMGEFENAREYALVSLENANEMGAAELKMLAMNNLGGLYLTVGAYDKGLEVADSIIALAEREGNITRIMAAHSLAAEFEKKRMNLDLALEHTQIALEIAVSNEEEREILRNEIGMANILAMQEKNLEARDIYRKVLPRSTASGYDWMEDAIWLGIGHTFEEEDPDSARYFYEKALSLIGRAAAEAGSAELGSGMQLGSRHEYYVEITEYYAGMALSTGEDEWSSDAFRTAEKAKARGLLDLVSNTIATEHSQEEEAVLDSIYSLDPEGEKYRQDLEYLERKYRNLRSERLESATGGLAQTGPVTDLKDVQKELPRGTAMFSYSIGHNRSWLWVIDRKGHDLIELPGRSELNSSVSRFSQALKRPGAGDAAVMTSARELYSTLVEPAESRLEKADRIIVVPDEILFEIPFEALISEEAGEGSQWKDLAFLFREHQVLYTPSASVYRELRREKQSGKYSLELFAVGDPDYSSMSEAGGITLRPLPDTRLEVESIGAKFKDDERIVLVGSEASEAALKGTISKQPSRILHIAAHGLVDPVTPTASSIALYAEPGDGEDGYLHTLEILALPLGSELVVLSACETATGRVSRGEGVVGLSRAFLGAGASAVVSSLWAVSDESTAQLMTAFYEKMRGKKRPAVRAMNEAKLEMLESGEYSHPFHWASFIVIGSEKSPW